MYRRVLHPSKIPGENTAGKNKRIRILFQWLSLEQTLTNLFVMGPIEGTTRSVPFYKSAADLYYLSSNLTYRGPVV